MKEKEFFKYGNMNKKDYFEIKIYYSLDDNGEVLLDEESIRDEFEDKLKEIKEILER